MHLQSGANVRGPRLRALIGLLAFGGVILMIDVGYDAGLSRDFGDTAGGDRPGFIAAPAATGRCVEPVAGPEKAAIGGPVAADTETRSPAPPGPASGPSTTSPAPTLPADRTGPPDFAGLDLAALQALSGLGTSLGAGSTDPASAIARQVADMAQGLAALADKLVGQPAPSSQDVLEADCIAFLEAQFRIRRLRGRHLPGLSLGEPAWDILLDLAIAQYWRRETSVTSLCIAADVPSTTALRWINSMTKAGLIVRRPCQRDGRRSFLAIAPASYQAMLALAADALRTVERVRSRYQRNAA